MVQFRTKEENVFIEMRRLREDFDNLMFQNGGQIPKTQAKCRKFAAQLYDIVNTRLDNSYMFKSNKPKLTRLPSKNKIDTINTEELNSKVTIRESENLSEE